YVMEFNRTYSTDAMAQIARALGVAKPDGNSDADARAAIDRVRTLCSAIGIPSTLEGLGLKADQLDWTIENALGAVRLVKNNPRPLDPDSMRLLVEAAFSGRAETLNS